MFSHAGHTLVKRWSNMEGITFLNTSQSLSTEARSWGAPALSLAALRA